MRKSGWYWVKVINRSKWGCYLWNGISWEGERGDRYSDELFDVVGPRIPTPDEPLQTAPDATQLVEALETACEYLPIGSRALKLARTALAAPHPSGCSSVGRASAFQAERQGFEPPQPLQLDSNKTRSNPMFTYFKDVLIRLEGIQDQLTVQNDLLREQNNHLSRLASCVQSNHHRHGDHQILEQPVKVIYKTTVPLST